MILHVLIGAVGGGALGFGWHKLVGCSTGACPLAANRWLSLVCGMVAGAAVAASFR